MHRTRFIFGVSVLFLAAGIVVTAQQGHGNAPKSTQATKPSWRSDCTSPATRKVTPRHRRAKATPTATASPSKVKPRQARQRRRTRDQGADETRKAVRR